MKAGSAVAKARAKPRNVLRGIVPSFTGFDDVNPTHLERATDGDMNTLTTDATKNNVNGVIGTFVFDLLSSKHLLVSAIGEIWSNTGNVYVYVDSSDVSNFAASTSNNTANGGSVSINQIMASEGDQNKTLRHGKFVYHYGRYLRIRAITSTTANGNITLKQVVGYELGV